MSSTITLIDGNTISADAVAETVKLADGRIVNLKRVRATLMECPRCGCICVPTKHHIIPKSYACHPEMLPYLSPGPRTVKICRGCHDDYERKAEFIRRELCAITSTSNAVARKSTKRIILTLGPDVVARIWVAHFHDDHKTLQEILPGTILGEHPIVYKVEWETDELIGPRRVPRKKYRMVVLNGKQPLSWYDQEIKKHLLPNERIVAKNTLDTLVQCPVTVLPNVAKKSFVDVIRGWFDAARRIINEEIRA